MSCSTQCNLTVITTTIIIIINIDLAIYKVFRGWFGVGVNGIGHINKDMQRQDRLKLGLVTTFGRSTIPLLIQAT